MVPRTLKIAYAAAPLLALLFASVLLLQVESVGLLHGRVAVTASANAGAGAANDVADALVRAAHESGADIVREFADIDDPERSRIVLVAPGSSGSQAARWLRDRSMRSFDPTVSTAARAMADLARFEPSGTYLVDGDASAVDHVRTALGEAGYSTTVEPLPTVLRAVLMTVSKTTVHALSIVALALVATTAAAVLRSGRRSAVRQVAGISFWRSTLSDAPAVAGSAALGLAATACITGFVSAVSEIDEPGRFIGMTAALSIAFVGLVAATHLCCGWFQHRRPIGPALRGAGTSALVVLVAQCTRIPATSAVVSAVFLAMSSASIVDAAADSNIRTAAGSAAVASITGDQGIVDDDIFWPTIGRMARDAAEHGDAFLAQKTEFVVGADLASDSHPMLVVDDGYLARQPIVDHDGKRITPARDHVVVVTPPALRNLARAVETEINQSRAFEARASDGQRLFAAGQRIFTYPDSPDRAAWMSDPILVVLPAATFPNDDELGAIVSTGDVLFTDAATAQRYATKHDLLPRFRSIVPIAQAMAENSKASAIDARVGFVTCAVAAGVAAFVGLTAAVTHRGRYGSRLFTRFASGWSFARAHLGLIAFEIVVGMCALVIAVNEWFARTPAGEALVPVGGPVQTAAPLAFIVSVAAIVALSAVSLGVLALTGRRAVRTHGKET
jgi:hypothetical protein